ncbi:MAG: hypothetical protein IPP68_05640 [Elusimicrobia bacterium]|nr:hypothetical protein [Elusimicrobiota bacterium]
MRGPRLPPSHHGRGPRLHGRHSSRALAGGPRIIPPPRLVGLGTALPSRSVSQGEALGFLLKFFPHRPATRALLTRVFAHESVETRRLAVNRLSELADRDLDRKNRRFEKTAVALSARSLADALRRAGRSARHIDFLAATTCTGFLCPGLAPRTADRAGLRPDVRLADLVGMGCGAALPALQTAADFCRSHPGALAAVVSTEICSAAFFPGDAPDLVISNALFGDGSAALLRGAGNHRRGIPRRSRLAGRPPLYDRRRPPAKRPVPPGPPPGRPGHPSGARRRPSPPNSPRDMTLGLHGGPGAGRPGTNVGFGSRRSGRQSRSSAVTATSPRPRCSSPFGNP